MPWNHPTYPSIQEATAVRGSGLDTLTCHNCGTELGEHYPNFTSPYKAQGQERVVSPWDGMLEWTLWLCYSDCWSPQQIESNSYLVLKEKAGKKFLGSLLKTNTIDL